MDSFGEAVRDPEPVTVAVSVTVKLMAVGLGDNVIECELRLDCVGWAVTDLDEAPVLLGDADAVLLLLTVTDPDVVVEPVDVREADVLFVTVGDDD